MIKSVPDPDMFIFIEKGMRSGVSYISNRYSKVNYKYLISYYSKQIIYLDENNFYGYAMSKFLLTSGFKWSLTWINIPAIVQQNALSKLILNIQRNYVNCTIIIL